MNITPSCTSGVVSFCPIGNDQLHAVRSWPTLERSICASGLSPRPAYVRRHTSQSLAGGSRSILSVTPVIAASFAAR
jgi:hypothetical protein